jgi:hypothetical protein
MSEKIHAAMIEVMGKVGSISKGRKNTTQNYSFRGIDDIYNAIHTHMADAGMYCLPEVLESSQEERKSKQGGILIYTKVRMKFTFVCAEDGSKVHAITEGEGMDSGDKSTNKAMSGAQKYLFIMSFCIPTAEPKDSENDSPEVADTAPKSDSKPETSAPDSKAQDTYNQFMHTLDTDKEIKNEKTLEAWYQDSRDVILKLPEELRKPLMSKITNMKADFEAESK